MKKVKYFVIAIVTLSVIFLLYSNIKKPETVVFVDNIELEYKQEITPSVLLDKYIDTEKSRFNEVTWNFETIDTQKITDTYKTIDLSATVDGIEETFQFKYKVVDVSVPHIYGPYGVITPFNTQVDFSDYLIVEDNVDGVIPFEINANIDYSIPGIYTATIIAKDSSDNTAEREISVRVKKEESKLNVIAEKVPVLAYHGVAKNADKENKYKANPLWISTSEFENQLKALKDNQYTTLTLDQYYNWYKNNEEIPEKSVLITFDDGIKEMVSNVTPLLEKYDYNAVSFNVLNSFDTPSDYSINLEEAINSSHVFEHQSHSYNFHYKIDNERTEIIYTLTQKEIENDIKSAKTVMNPKYIAYPYGAYTKDLIEQLENQHYKLAFEFETVPNKRLLSMPKDGQWNVRRLPILHNLDINAFIAKLLN